MAKTLQEVREMWERELTLILEVPVFIKNRANDELDKLIVILKDNDGKFHINRYFPIYMPLDDKTDYQISADLQHGTANQVFETFNRLFPEGIKTNLI